jgi:hypothetical protein
MLSTYEQKFGTEIQYFILGSFGVASWAVVPYNWKEHTGATALPVALASLWRN